MTWGEPSPFIRFGLASIIAFSSFASPILAQGDFRIDEDGNIILLESELDREEELKKPAETSPPSKSPQATPQAEPATQTVEEAPPPKPVEELPQVQKTEPAPVRSPTTEEPPLQTRKVRDGFTAFVTPRIAEAYTQPDTESPLVAQLRKGDTVKLLEGYQNFYKVEYLIDDEFPVQGWMLKGALQVQSPGSDPLAIEDDQIYRPEIKSEEVVTAVKELPRRALEESVEIRTGEIESQNQAVSTNIRRRKKDPNIQIKQDSKKAESRRKPKPYRWHLDASLGFSSLEEKVTSATAASTAQNEFIDYDMSGFEVVLGGAFVWEFESIVDVGAKTQYVLDILSSNVPGSSTTINDSGVTAQFHDVGFGPVVSRKFAFPQARIKLEPELWLSGHMQFFDPNQLQDSARSQSVLFGHVAFYGRALFSPRVEAPYGFTVSPSIGTIFMYNFQETPVEVVTRDDNGNALEQIRTGSPKATNFALQYGGEVAWNMGELSWGQGSLFFRGFLKEFPKKFSGNGNRGGVRTTSAESELSKLEISLGYRHQF